MFRIATPISHLFKSETDAAQIVGSSDCLECRDHSPQEDHIELHELFHFELQIIHPISEESFEYIRKTIVSKPYLKLISFHVATCCDRPLIVEQIDPPNKFLIFELGGREYTYEEMQQIAADNIARIRTFIPEGMTICVENNNYLLSPAYKHIIEPQFLHDLVTRNNIYFLYDIAHAHISAINMGRTFEQYYAGLPIAKTKQVHICKFGMRNEQLAFDAHLAPDEFIFDQLRALFPLADIDYVTVEYYKGLDGLLTSLLHLKNMQNELSR